MKISVVPDQICAYTGDADDERDQNLEESCKYKTLLSLVNVLGSKTLLDDVLVEAPVTQVGKPHGTYNQDDTRKCEVGIIGDVGVQVCLTLNYKVEVAVTGNVSQTFHNLTQSGDGTVNTKVRSNGLQSKESGDKTTTNQECNLHYIGPCNRCKTTVD